ncbi:MAG: hypothetical protein K9L82_06750 [Chromatiaceae bacterium]|nr:hypothetical protein [Chromatiaceae bacterium]
MLDTMLNKKTASALLVLCATSLAVGAQGLGETLAAQPDVTIAELMPPAEQFEPTNVAVMTNDTEKGLAVTLELKDATAASTAMPVPFMLTQRGLYVRMVRDAIDNPSQFAADAQTAAALGLPEGLPCVGSVSQDNTLYCRAGDTAILQLGGSGTQHMDAVLAIANALPFERYREVFAE